MFTQFHVWLRVPGGIGLPGSSGLTATLKEILVGHPTLVSVDGLGYSLDYAVIT
jgi:hypothetical protein